MDFAIGTKGVMGRFYKRLEGAFDKSWASKLGMAFFDSDQAQETYPWLGQVPAFREMIGGIQPKGLRENSLSIRNKKFEASLEIGEDDYRRDKTNQLNTRINELARKNVNHWESLISTLILNGTGTTSGLAYDGQYFFDTDHAEGASGTQKNIVTASEVTDLNVSDPTKPTPAEFASVLLGCIAWFYTLKDDQGEPSNGDALNFMVMTPINLWGAAKTAVSQTILSAGSGTVLPSVLQGTEFKIEVVPNPRLSSWTTDFAVFRTDGDTRPFILQQEQDAKIDVIGPGSEHAIKNGTHIYTVKCIRNVGYGQWQHALKCSLS